MATGIVIWFSIAKGYGFIAPEQGGYDIFAHFSSISMDGYKTLKKVQKVEFQCTQGPKGLHATEISPTGEMVAMAEVHEKEAMMAH